MYKLNGTIKMFRGYVPFEYADNILKIYFRDDFCKKHHIKAQDILEKIGKNKTSKSYNKLEGVINGTCHIVEFYYLPHKYFCENNSSTFGTQYIVYVYTSETLIYRGGYMGTLEYDCLTFRSKKFYRFLSMKPAFKEKRDDYLKYEVDYDFPILGKESSFTIEGQKINIIPIPILSDNGPVVENVPAIRIHFGKMKIGKILKIYETMLKFIKCSFMREDICPDRVTFKIGDRYGEIDSPSLKKYPYDEGDLSSEDRDSLHYEQLYEHADGLFSLIYNDDIYMSHLPATLQDRYTITSESISKLCASFESEFKKSPLSKEDLISEERKALERKVRKALKNLREESSDDEEKETYNRLLNYVSISSFQKSLEVAFKDNEAALEKAKKKLHIKEDVSTIAIAITEYRNMVDHGRKKKEGKLPPDIDADKVASFFALLNCLVYALQLQRAGFKKDEINVMLANLYNRTQTVTLEI